MRRSAPVSAPTKNRGCRYWLNLALVGLAGLWVGYFVIAIYSVTVPNPQTICCTTPADDGFEFEGVTFTGSDKEPKTIWFIPETGHGGGPKVRPEEYAERLVSFYDDVLLSGRLGSE